MTPVVVIELDPTDPDTRRIWTNALALVDELDGEWTLIGGLMVQLLSERYGQAGGRPTNDVDVLADSRARPSMTERLSVQLDQLGFTVNPVGLDMGTAYRFTRGDEIVDVLGTDGVKSPSNTLRPLKTVSVPGG